MRGDLYLHVSWCRPDIAWILIESEIAYNRIPGGTVTGRGDVNIDRTIAGVIEAAQAEIAARRSSPIIGENRQTHGWRIPVADDGVGGIFYQRNLLAGEIRSWSRKRSQELVGASTDMPVGSGSIVRSIFSRRLHAFGSIR